MALALDLLPQATCAFGLFVRTVAAHSRPQVQPAGRRLLPAHHRADAHQVAGLALAADLATGLGDLGPTSPAAADFKVGLAACCRELGV